MSYLNTLKKSSQKNLEKLTTKLESLNTSQKFEADKRYWKPTVDKDGKGSAIIRFLPPKEGEDMPFVRYFDHAFQGPTGKWYFERSLTSLGRDVKDPCGEKNNQLWNSTEDEKSPARKQASEQKRHLHNVSNIYVISDPLAPENEGNVFLYDYGQSIMNKIDAALRPDEVDKKEPIDAFNVFEGANLVLKMRNKKSDSAKKKGFRTYEDSYWDETGPLFENDDELEEVLGKLYSLDEIVSADKYKSYDELKARLNLVLGLTPSGNEPDESHSETAQPKKTKTVEVEPEDDDEPPFEVENEDDEFSQRFKAIMNEDD